MTQHCSSSYTIDSRSTTISSNDSSAVDTKRYNHAQSSLLHSFIFFASSSQAVLVGDPLQIKPILHEEEWKDENIYTMVNLDRFENPVTEPIQFVIENLSMQYRSLPAIGELFSQYAYDGKLRHYRSAMENHIKFGKLNLKPINFIPLKVERYDSVFGIKKLDGSNVHIYSVLFTLEIFKYIVR